ncbi:MAG TPA: hypothetical protein VMB50_24550 [Myxococcales bacterium]|nr:hypothetical protein [Myxococcales bacterium]
MKGALWLLPLALGACSGSGGGDAGLDFGCLAAAVYDAGAVGSASQVLPAARAVAQIWKPGMRLTGLTGTLGPDGTDLAPDAGWTFTFESPPNPVATGTQSGGLAILRPLADQTVLTGFCGFAGAASPLAWTVDSTAAFAIAADAGCPFGPLTKVQLQAGSYLTGGDPTWVIAGESPDGGVEPCIVDAETGSYGLPYVDAGPQDAGPADAGRGDAGDGG